VLRLLLKQEVWGSNPEQIKSVNVHLSKNDDILSVGKDYCALALRLGLGLVEIRFRSNEELYIVKPANYSQVISVKRIFKQV